MAQKSGGARAHWLDVLPEAEAVERTAGQKPLSESLSAERGLVTPNQGFGNAPPHKSALSRPKRPTAIGWKTKRHPHVDLVAVGMYEKEKHGVKLRDKTRKRNQKEDGGLRKGGVGKRRVYF